ncbi:hypothetical protein [Streptomyces sp. NPDC054952]
MLRVHFDPADLARVRIARSPDPLAETVLSLPALQAGERGGVALAGWRERTRRGLRSTVRPLLELAPGAAGEYVPEAFVHAATGALPDSLDHTWSLPRRQWTADLRATEHLRPGTPRWINALHRGEREWRGLVDRTVREYHAVAVAPYWAQLVATAQADRTRRAAITVDVGVDGLLGSLHPFRDAGRHRRPGPPDRNVPRHREPSRDRPACGGPAQHRAGRQRCPPHADAVGAGAARGRFRLKTGPPPARVSPG